MRNFLLVVAAAWLLGFVPVEAQTYFSRTPGGTWNNVNTWSNTSGGPPAGSVPNAATHNVVIEAGHTVTIVEQPIINNLTINGILNFSNTSSDTLDVHGNITIAPTGVFSVAPPTPSGYDNYLLLRGNAVNNGTWDFRPIPSANSRRAVVVFTSPSLQTLTGNPIALSRFHRVYLSKGARSNFVECSFSLDVGVATGPTQEAFDFSNADFAPLGGTWRHLTGTLSFNQGTGVSRAQRIEVQGGIHIVGTANMLFGQEGSGATFIIFGGELLFNTSSSTPSRLGLGAGNSLEYNGNSNVSSFIIQQGTVIIASRISRDATTDALNFNQSGGTLILGNVGNNILSQKSLFDLPISSSTFTMSGGTIILRNASPYAMSNRPADFFIGSGVTTNISGGTIQFGDAQSSPNQVFSINVPSTTLLQNLTVFNGARLHPFSPTQNLRLAGNFTVNGAFDGTQTHPSNPMPATSTLTMQGNNTANQSISGVGTITLHNLTMNRQGTGTGVAQVLKGLTLAGVLNLQEIASLSPQILELGSGVDVTINNNAFNAVQSAADTRSVRTSTASGRLYRALTGTNEYLYPLSSLGSGINPQPTYTPLTYYAVSASGRLGAKVAAGGNQTLLGAHKQAPSGITSYARRAWSLATGGIGGTGRLAVKIPSDVFGSPDVLRFARYLPNEETAGNQWLYTDTLTSRAAIEFEGDWTWLEAALRVFYSRASGVWTDAASWSFVSHRALAVPSGVFPSRVTDSVVIGGGMNGTNNHVITLQNPVTIGGTAVGIGTANTGTLECTDEAWLGGTTFTLGERSTLRIGAARGITALSSDVGNVRATALRLFPTNAQYEYIGTNDQELGNGLPTIVFALGVAKPVLTTLLANRNIGVWQNMNVASGILDAQTFTFRNETTATAGGIMPSTFTLGANGMLRIGGTRGFADASTGTVSNYAAYSMDERSTVEFYGTQHVLEAVPAASGASVGVGYGNVSLRGMASVNAWNPVLVRGSLWVRDGVRFVNYSRDVRVLGSMYNNASVVNNGVLDIGQ